MAKLKISNNAVSRLSANISPVDTSISLLPGGGAKFPSLAADEWFPGTIVKVDGTMEIVRVTARATDVLTVARGQEDTAAVSFAAGDRFEHRFTAAAFTEENERVEMIAQDALDTASSSVDDLIASLAGDSGSSMIGNDGETIAQSLSALQLSDYAELRAYNGPRKAVFITGYMALSSPYGMSGMFVRNDSDTTTTDNGGTIIVASNGIRWVRQFTGLVNVLWFGAVPGMSFDSYSAIQKCLNYCASSGQPMYVPKQFKVSSQLLKSESFTCPNIIGDGFNVSALIGVGIPAGSAILKIKGGSGQFTGAQISGIKFSADATNIGIEVADQCGLAISRCQFDVLARGSRFHNESGFTEYVVMRQCDYTTSCVQSHEWIRTFGTESFHGSGLLECTINEPPEATTESITINENCLVYNAPLSFQIWKRSTQPTIQHNGDMRSNVYGNITTELFFGGDNRTELVRGNPLFILGELSSFGNFTDTTLAKFVERVQVNTDGTVNFHEKPVNKLAIGVPPGNISILGILNQQTMMVDVLFTAANYEYSYTLIAYANPNDGSGSATILATNRAFNAAGYGPVVFSVSGNALVASNASFPAIGVTAYLTCTQIGARIQKRMQ